MRERQGQDAMSDGRPAYPEVGLELELRLTSSSPFFLLLTFFFPDLTAASICASSIARLTVCSQKAVKGSERHNSYARPLL